MSLFRIHVLFFLFMLSISFSGCGGGSDSKGSNKNPSPPSQEPENPNPENTMSPPKVVNIGFEENKNLYGLENNIIIQVTFDKVVIVHSVQENVPKIKLYLDIDVFRDALYYRGTRTRTLSFQYKVKSGDGHRDDLETASAINLNGASIVDTTGNAAIILLIPIRTSIDAIVPTAPSSLTLHSPSSRHSTDPIPEILVSGVEPLAEVQLYSDRSCTVSASTSVSVPEGSSSVIIEATRLTNESGTVIYYSLQVDGAGNKSGCSSASLSYTYDIIATAPSGLTLHSPSAIPGADPTPEILVSGVEPLARVQLYSDSTCTVSASASVSVPEGSSSVIIEATRLTNESGTVIYYSRQVDGAGNRSNCSSASLSYTYDIIATAPSSLTLHSPSHNHSTDPTPEILVSGVEPLARVQLYSDSTCTVSASTSVPVPGGSSSVIVEATPLTENRLVAYFARQVDTVGNRSNCSSASLSYTYDIIATAPSGLTLHSPSQSPQY